MEEIENSYINYGRSSVAYSNSSLRHANSKPWVSDSFLAPSASSDRKRSYSTHYDLVGNGKIFKTADYDEVQSARNDMNAGANDDSLMTVRDIAFASQQTCSTRFQSSTSAPISRQSEQHGMHPTNISNQNYDFNGDSNDHIDPVQGSYGLSFNPNMPARSNWTINHTMPSETSSVAATSGNNMFNGLGTVSSNDRNNISALSCMENSSSNVAATSGNDMSSCLGTDSSNKRNNINALPYMGNSTSSVAATSGNGLCNVLGSVSSHDRNNITALSYMGNSTSSAASTSGNGTSNVLGTVSSNNRNNISALSPMGNSTPVFYTSISDMASPCPIVNDEVTTIPIFNTREPIVINGAVLTPPPPGAILPARNLKPPGCRTVFVSNLPESITEESVREIFVRCGPISAVHISQKKSCHIRFVKTESTDQALFLSGFRIRPEASDDVAWVSRLHVEYSAAREDQREYECLERTRLREERHRLKALCPSLPSVLEIPHYTEDEAAIVASKLRREEAYRDGLQLLITWLHRGACNKRSSSSFFSLIQSTHSHARRLRCEKSEAEADIDKAKEKLLKKIRAIALEVIEIEKVFEAAKIQKVWDHFTKSQRKKIEEMRSDILDLKKTNSEDLVAERVEEEMDLGNAVEESVAEEANGPAFSLAEELENFKSENDALCKENARLSENLDIFKSENATLKEEVLRLRLELENSKRNEKNDIASTISQDNQVSINNECALKINH